MINDLDAEKILSQEDVKKKISEELVKNLSRYRNSLKLMALDAPISLLNLPRVVEKVLSDNGLHRIYDLSDIDFVEIKGLTETARNRLTASFNEFISMC
jgi:hypothetical protein